MIPSTQPAQRIAVLFHRKLSTHWSEKEVRWYRQLVKDGYLEAGEMYLIERYYAFERRKGEKGIHRRDLFTFLNNFAGELDRARAWDEGVNRKKNRHQSTNVNNGQHPVSDNEFQRIGDLARAELDALRTRLKHA